MINNWENQLAELIDWSHPDLADVPAPERAAEPRPKLRIEAGRPRRRLGAVINRIRRHDHNYFGFPVGFLDALRQ